MSRFLSWMTPGLAAAGFMLVAVMACEPPAAEKPAEAVGEPTPAVVDVIAPETDPVASIDGQALSLERFNKLYRARMPALRNRVRGSESLTAVRLKQAVLEQLIDETLLERAAGGRGVTVTQGEIDAALAEFRAGFADEASYRQAVETAGGPMALRQQMERSTLRRKLAGRAPPPTEAEVAAAYRQQLDRWQQPSHLLADEIAVDKTSPDAAEALAALRARLIGSGSSFGHAARMHAGGRDLGRITAESVDGVRWAALEALDAGEISPVVDVGDAFVLLRLRARVEASSVSLEAATPVIRRELLARRRAAREAELLANLRAEADIQSHLEARYAALLEPAAEAIRAGVGFSSIRDQLPADVASGEGRSGAPE